MFENCKSLNELKSAYHRACIANHPDLGGDVRKMQEINAAYGLAFDRLKSAQNFEAARPESETKPCTEAPEEFREILNILLGLEGLEVELCGSWLWISGETFEHRDVLKAAGCKWSRAKGKWHWHHVEEGKSWYRGNQTMDNIRLKYGSQSFSADSRQRITA